MKKVFLDYAAGTPCDKKVVKMMDKFWNCEFGNPSSIHSFGVSAKKIVESARETIAKFLNAHSREIIFTSGGTEANNLAIFGLINQVRKDGKKYSDIHLITTEIEHSSILECFKELENRGARVDYLNVDEFGIINSKDLRELIKPETMLVSIGYANSEIGVIQPIKEIIKEIRHKRKEFGRDRISYPYFHLDASQAVEYLNMNVEELGADLITLDAQKIYGSKGIGALYVRDSVKILPIIFGGGQEKGFRSGTENVSLIVGFSEAIKIVEKIKNKENLRLIKIRDNFFNKIKKVIPNVIINGDINSRLPNNIDISIPGEDGEMLVLRLDERGIITSSASACTSGDGESYVVRRIAEKTDASKENIDERVKSTLRISMGRGTTAEHLTRLINSLKKVINKL